MSNKQICMLGVEASGRTFHGNPSGVLPCPSDAQNTPATRDSLLQKAALSDRPEGSGLLLSAASESWGEGSVSQALAARCKPEDSLWSPCQNAGYGGVHV